MVIDRIFIFPVAQCIRKEIQAVQVLPNHVGHSEHQGILIFLPPFVEGCCGADFKRNPGCEKSHYRIVTPEHSWPTELVFETFDLLTHRFHLIEKTGLPSQPSLKNTLTEEHLVRGLFIHPPVMHASPFYNVESAAYNRFHPIDRALFLIPMSFSVAATTEVWCDHFHPIRLDTRHPPRPQPRCLD